jgi:short-subunit dehydrogenase
VTLDQESLFPFDSRIFTNRVAIVTGGSGGIGAAIAAAFAQCGAKVALLARNEDRLLLLAEAIAGRGGVAVPVKCDVADAAQTAFSVREVVASLGCIDILVNAAGIATPAPVAVASLADLREMMDVNYFGVVHMIQAVLPEMREQGSGHIVNIGSIGGQRAEATLAGYCASKFALAGFTEAIAIELFGTGINISLVSPTAVDTPLLDNPEWRRRRWALQPYVMPPELVVSAVLAAITYRLTQIDVPIGSGAAQKMASLYPNLYLPWYAFATRVIGLFNDFLQRDSESYW